MSIGQFATNTDSVAGLVKVFIQRPSYITQVISHDRRPTILLMGQFHWMTFKEEFFKGMVKSGTGVISCSNTWHREMSIRNNYMKINEGF